MSEGSYDDYNGSVYQELRPSIISPTSLLLIGFILGLIGSLTYAWILAPVVYVGVSPARMSDTHRADYLYLISESYAAGSSWEQTQLRLAALGDPNIDQTVAAALDESLRKGEPAPVLRNLALLADRLGIRSPAVAAFIPRSLGTTTSGSEQIQPTPTLRVTQPPSTLLAPTETPTREPTATPLPVYRLLSKEQVCLNDSDNRLLEIEVVDSLLQPLPGAEIIVSWDGGIDHFFTGFQPEKGAGYADFLMEEGVSYEVEMADGSPVESQIQVSLCSVGPRTYLGGLRLVYQNSDVQQDEPGS